jgi:hypothetical protein
LRTSPATIGMNDQPSHAHSAARTAAPNALAPTGCVAAVRKCAALPDDENR